MEFLFAPAILALVGVLIKYFKMSFLIAGYNTSPKEQKEKYDVDALCKFVGNLLFQLSAILLLIAIAKMLNVLYFETVLSIGFALFIIVTIGSVIYMNTGNRFKK